MTSTRPAPTAIDFFTGFALGFGRVFQGLSLLFNHSGLKRYALLPLIVNVILYLVVITLFIWMVASWDIQVGEWQFLGPVGGWLSTVLDYLLDTLKWLIAIPLLLIVCYFSFTIVGLILAAPFNELLSSRVEKKLRDPAASLTSKGAGLLRDTWESIVDALRILGRQILWTIPVLPLLFVPLVGWIPLFVVTGWFTGLGLVDPTLARHRRTRKEKDAITAARFGEVLGLGIAFELLLLVPFLGLFVLPVAVTGGTMVAVNADPLPSPARSDSAPVGAG